MTMSDGGVRGKGRMKKGRANVRVGLVYIVLKCVLLLGIIGCRAVSF